MDDGFTVIIPTYNMAAFLPALWQSLVRSGVTELATEVLFVNDGPRTTRWRYWSNWTVAATQGRENCAS